jgi:GNAT superfamily N-acetyltransferase
MSVEWLLRQAGIEDAGRLALIGGATFLETFAGLLQGDAIVSHCAHEHGVEAYHTLLAHEDSAAWVAEAQGGGAPIGYALVTAPKLAQAEPGDLELKRIYSFSRMHGTGLGAALMGRAAFHAAESGARRLLLASSSAICARWLSTGGMVSRRSANAISASVARIARMSCSRNYSAGTGSEQTSVHRASTSSASRSGVSRIEAVRDPAAG